MRRSTKLAQRLLSNTNPSSPSSQKRSAEVPLTTYEIYQRQKRHNSGSDFELSKDINNANSYASANSVHNGKASSETSGSAIYNNYLNSPSMSTVSMNDSDSKQDSSSVNVPPIPKIHRGFGASAHIYNKDLKANVTGKIIYNIYNTLNRFKNY